MIQLNLLPDIKLDYVKAQKQKKLYITIAAITSVLALAATGLMAFYVFAIQSVHSDNLEKDIAENVKTLQSKEDLPEILTVQNQLNVLPELHDNRPIVSRVTSYLTILTPEDVQLESLEISYPNTSLSDEYDTGDGVFEITGSAKDAKEINKFIDSMKFAIFKSKDNADINAFNVVELNSSSKDGDRTEFTITAQFNNIIFASSTEDIKLEVPSIESTQSSTERPGAQRTTPGSNSPLFNGQQDGQEDQNDQNEQGDSDG